MTAPSRGKRMLPRIAHERRVAPEAPVDHAAQLDRGAVVCAASSGPEAHALRRRPYGQSRRHGDEHGPLQTAGRCRGEGAHHQVRGRCWPAPSLREWPILTRGLEQERGRAGEEPSCRTGRGVKVSLLARRTCRGPDDDPGQRVTRKAHRIGRAHFRAVMRMGVHKGDDRPAALGGGSAHHQLFRWVDFERIRETRMVRQQQHLLPSALVHRAEAADFPGASGTLPFDNHRQGIVGQTRRAFQRCHCGLVP